MWVARRKQMQLERLLWAIWQAGKSRPAERAAVGVFRVPEPAIKALLMEDVVAREWADVVLVLDRFEANSTTSRNTYISQPNPADVWVERGMVLAEKFTMSLDLARVEAPRSLCSLMLTATFLGTSA